MEGIMVKKKSVCMVNFQGNPYFNHHKQIEKFSEKASYSPWTNLKDQSVVLNFVSPINLDWRASEKQAEFQAQIY